MKHMMAVTGTMLCCAALQFSGVESLWAYFSVGVFFGVSTWGER